MLSEISIEDYLLPPEAARNIGIDQETDPARYMRARASALHERLKFVMARAARGELDVGEDQLAPFRRAFRFESSVPQDPLLAGRKDAGGRLGRVRAASRSIARKRGLNRRSTE